MSREGVKSEGLGQGSDKPPAVLNTCVHAPCMRLLQLLSGTLDRLDKTKR